MEALIELLAKVFDQIGNIVAALAERRKRDADYIDAIEKIGSEAAAFDFARQVSIRRADHAGIHALFFVVADAREMAVLENVE